MEDTKFTAEQVTGIEKYLKACIAKGTPQEIKAAQTLLPDFRNRVLVASKAGQPQ